MSDAKHSPGPWTTQHGLIYSAEGHTVASCINEDGDFSDPVRGPHDAELIASAPDLRARVAELEAQAKHWQDIASDYWQRIEAMQLATESASVAPTPERRNAHFAEKWGNVLKELGKEGGK